MKKILLIEDRSIRQQFFTNDLNINLKKYNDILDNYIDELYLELELQLKNNSFNFDTYNYIVCHKSAFGEQNNELLERLKDYCKVHKKVLVLFSGGISSNYYDTSESEILELNSKTFYSKNLELFLKEVKTNNNVNLLLLAFGEKWKLNLIFNVLEKLNTINCNDIDDWDEFNDESDIHSINDLIDLEVFKDEEEITFEVIENIKNLIFQYINQKLGIYYE
jgi:hypothetical protein